MTDPDSPETPDEKLIADLRVVDLCDPTAGRVAAAFTGKLLADFGADVVKVEPPGGDALRRVGPFATRDPNPETSAAFLQYNTSKRGVTIDIESRAGFWLLESLLDSADVFLTDLQRAAWPPALIESVQRRGVSQALLVVAVTPFGLDGPEADTPTTPLTVGHASGGAYNLVNVFGTSGGDPLPLAGRAFEADAGLAAAVATMAALHERRESGIGQLIDVAESEAIQSLDRVDNSVQINGPVMAGIPGGRDGMMACRDGFAIMVTGQAHQWRSMLELLGDPAWAFDEEGQLRSRPEIADHSREALRNWVGGRSKAEVYHATQAEGVPTGPVLTPAEVLASEQEEALGFFEEIPHPVAGSWRYPGYSARFGDLRPSRSPAPTLGEHNAEILGPLLDASFGGGWGLAEARRAGVI